jgi:hypothetical protein
MKVYVCGSFKFVERVERLEEQLVAAGIPHELSKTADPRGIASCLDKIDGAEIVYVVNPGGYIGRSLAFDLGYALARGRQICCLERIEDPPIAGLLGDVLTFDELVARAGSGAAATGE